MTFRPVTIEDGRVVEHRPDKYERFARECDREDMRKLGVWVQANLQHHAGKFWSEAIADEFADLRSRLAAAETALADRDRHFQWDDRLRMEREIGDLALRLATVEAERDRLRIVEAAAWRMYGRLDREGSDVIEAELVEFRKALNRGAPTPGGTP